MRNCEVKRLYFSRIELDLRRRSTMLALANPQHIHGAVENAFSGERQRRLWRLDTLDDKLYLLIVSEDAPNLSGISAQFGTDEPGQTKDYTPFLERLGENSLWRFRLTVNPTKSVKTEAEARGTVKALVTTAGAEKWLADRAQKHGFQLQPNQFGVTGTRWLHFRKHGGGRTVSLYSVTIEGVLLITDVEAFRKTLTEGIGRGKAYGQGLLTITRGGGGRA